MNSFTAGNCLSVVGAFIEDFCVLKGIVASASPYNLNLSVICVLNNIIII